MTYACACGWRGESARDGAAFKGCPECGRLVTFGRTRTALDAADEHVVKMLVRQTWVQIDFQYDRLTPEEKAVITHDQFRRICAWMGETAR